MTVEVQQGQFATLNLELRNRDGDLADADADTLELTVRELDGDALVGFPIAQDDLTHADTGLYSYLWSVPDALATGTYEAQWDGSVDAEQIETAREAVFVLPEAMPTFTFPVEADVFRLFATTALGDGALGTLLNAAAQTILIHAGSFIATSGADDEINEIFTPRGIGPLLRLSRRAESISEVIEGTETLAADDYELRSSGYVLRRLNDGTNPALYWRNRVYVTYAPLSDTALRAIAQIALVKLDIAFNPALASQTIGAWSESYVQGKSYPEQRADILASLTPEPAGIW